MAINIISLESFSRFQGMLETVDCFQVIPLLRDSQGNTIQMPFSSGHIKFLDDHFHRTFAQRFILDSCNLPAPQCLNSKTNQKHRYGRRLSGIWHTMSWHSTVCLCESRRTLSPFSHCSLIDWSNYPTFLFDTVGSYSNCFLNECLQVGRMYAL